MSFAYVVETCLMACTASTWCVDTGATNHVCNSLQEFQKTRRLANGENLWLGDTLRVMAVAVGVVSLLFPGGKLLVLNDCLYVPNVRRNLISIFCLSCNGYSTIFNKNMVSIKCNADDIYNGILVDNLYRTYITYTS